MYDTFLVIYRGEDEPSIELLDRTKLKKYLFSEWEDYTLLNYPPDLMCMPTNSIFIMQGDIVNSVYNI